MTSTNIGSSYGPIQEQCYEESAYLYPRSSNTTTASASTVPGSAYDDCLMPSYLHQHNSYQPTKTPQTVPFLSTSSPLAQGDLFSALDTCRYHWHMGIYSALLDTRHSHWHMRICSTFLDIRLRALLKFKERHTVKVVFWNHNLFPKVHSSDGFKNRLLSR
jgi:hypothetical protein